MTIETTWVRVFLGTTGRFVATCAGLFVLILAAPIVLAVLGLWLVAVLALLVGLVCLAALVAGMLPGRHHRR